MNVPLLVLRHVSTLMRWFVIIELCNDRTTATDGHNKSLLFYFKLFQTLLFAVHRFFLIFDGIIIV